MMHEHYNDTIMNHEFYNDHTTLYLQWSYYTILTIIILHYTYNNHTYTDHNTLSLQWSYIIFTMIILHYTYNDQTTLYLHWSYYIIFTMTILHYTYNDHTTLYLHWSYYAILTMIILHHTYMNTVIPVIYMLSLLTCMYVTLWWIIEFRVSSWSSCTMYYHLVLK